MRRQIAVADVEGGGARPRARATITSGRWRSGAWSWRGYDSTGAQRSWWRAFSATVAGDHGSHRLTGGIACGKTAVARLFRLRARGAGGRRRPGRARRGSAGTEGLRRWWPRWAPTCLHQTGTLDRKRLGQRVFGDNEAPAARRNPPSRASRPSFARLAALGVEGHDFALYDAALPPSRTARTATSRPRGGHRAPLTSSSARLVARAREHRRPRPAPASPPRSSCLARRVAAATWVVDNPATARASGPGVAFYADPWSPLRAACAAEAAMSDVARHGLPRLLAPVARRLSRDGPGEVACSLLAAALSSTTRGASPSLCRAGDGDRGRRHGDRPRARRRGYLDLARRVAVVHHAAQSTWEAAPPGVVGALPRRGRTRWRSSPRPRGASGGRFAGGGVPAPRWWRATTGPVREGDLELRAGLPLRGRALALSSRADAPARGRRGAGDGGAPVDHGGPLGDGRGRRARRPYLYLAVLLESPVDITLPLPARGANALDVVPVDHVARAGVRLAEVAHEGLRTYHVVDRGALPARPRSELFAEAARGGVRASGMPVHLARAVLRTPGVDRLGAACGLRAPRHPQPSSTTLRPAALSPPRASRARRSSRTRPPVAVAAARQRLRARRVRPTPSRRSRGRRPARVTAPEGAPSLGASCPHPWGSPHFA